MKNIVCFFSIFTFTALSFGQIAVHAHRGEPHKAPENTPESIALAFELGSLMIETDVNLTKSGDMLVFHGRRELKKYWGIDKAPADVTLEDAKNSKLICPEKFHPKYANVKIPTLDDILKVIPKDKSFELEIKTYGKDFARKTVEAFKRAGLTEKNVLITSFDSEVIKDFKSQYPQFETLYICMVRKNKGKLSRTVDDIIKVARDAGASQVAIGGYKNIDRAFVKKIQDAGFKVGVWQVENLDDLDYAARLGVNRVCSNYAYELREAYKRIKNLEFK